MVNRFTTFVATAFFLAYSVMSAAVPPGQVTLKGKRTAGPGFTQRAWETMIGNTPKSRALDKYVEDHQEIFENYIPLAKKIEADHVHYGYALWEKEDPSDTYAELGVTLPNYSKFVFTRNMKKDQDTYTIKTGYGTNPISFIINTDQSSPPTILRVITESRSGFFRNITYVSSAQPGVVQKNYGDMNDYEKSIFDTCQFWIDSVRTHFNLEEALPLLEDIEIPEYPSHSEPYTAIITNVPFVSDRRKKTEVEQIIEEEERKIKSNSLETARKDISAQVQEGNRIVHAPVDSLFSIAELADVYHQAIADEHYQKGMAEPMENAFRNLKKYDKLFFKMFPEEFTLIGLGSDVGIYDDDIMSLAHMQNKHAQSYWNIDSESAITSAMEYIYRVPVNGATLDLARDQEALTKVLATIDGPRVFFTKDTDVNWANPTKMYEGLYQAMHKGEFLIRAGPLEHPKMEDTYKAIEPAARTYLEYLGLDNTNWKFLGCQYDAETKEFHNDFQATAPDILEGTETSQVILPGQIFRHLTSRRKSMRPELEEIGFTFAQGVEVPGYSINMYVK